MNRENQSKVDWEQRVNTSLDVSIDGKSFVDFYAKVMQEIEAGQKQLEEAREINKAGKNINYHIDIQVRAARASMERERLEMAKEKLEKAVENSQVDEAIAKKKRELDSLKEEEKQLLAEKEQKKKEKKDKKAKRKKLLDALLKAAMEQDE